jgi:hypothetical protein
MAGDIIFYQFSRPKVEQCDFSHFLGLYAPDRLPTGSRLREMMDRMIFLISGYDDDAREVHTIHEVRRFYTVFHQAWPYWLYFCNLDTKELQMMVMCCLSSLAAMKVDGRPNVAVKYDRLELLRFVSNDFSPMNVMCERAEMTERMIYDRSKAGWALHVEGVYWNCSVRSEFEASGCPSNDKAHHGQRDHPTQDHLR